MNLRPRHREDPEINLISMIDVLLVLLIFSWCRPRSTRRARQGAASPGEPGRAAARTARPAVVTVTADGSYRVNERTLINASPDTLRAALLKEAGTDRAHHHPRRWTQHASGVVTAMDVAGKLGSPAQHRHRARGCAPLSSAAASGPKPAGDSWSIYGGCSSTRGPTSACS